MKLQPLILLAVIPILFAAPPPRVTDKDLARFERLVTPKDRPDLGAVESYKKAEALNQATAKRMVDFLDSAGQSTLISQSDSEAPSQDEIEDPLEGLFEPEPDTLLISCSKGIYLDGESYEIDYLGKVKIQGKGLTMTCDKEAEKKLPLEESKKDPLAKFGGFGELKQFTAGGNVRVNGKTEDGQKVYMGGDNALYEMSKGGELENSTITFRGKKIGFMMGDVTDKSDKATSYAMTSISDDAWIKAVVRGQMLFVEWSPTGWLTKVGFPPQAPEKK
ncbi:MAG: hypothetical protein ACPGQF_02175 [Akkermansiaceae bacterium]